MSNPTGPVPPPFPPAPPPRSGIKTPVVLAIVGTVVGLLGLMSVCCCGLAFVGRNSRPASQPKQSQVQSAPQVNLADLPTEKFVGAELLFSQYSGNQVASDAKYKNKTILVVGEVSTVEKAEIGDEMGIVFSCKHKFPGVRC